MHTDDRDGLLLRIPEAAERLRLGRSTVYELIAAQEIRTIHVGRAVRIPAAELVAFVERRTRDEDGLPAPAA